jgi:hypothetical protein
MNRLIILLFAALLFNPCTAQDSGKHPDTNMNITILGVIKNYSELLTAVRPDTTFFQLVPISPDGRINMLYGGNGLAGFGSDFPKLGIPKEASFSFEISNVPPGKYILAVQSLNPKKYGKEAGYITSDGQNFLIFKIKPNSKSPVTINLGKTTALVN